MTQSIVERLTLKTRIGYGIGDIAICLYWSGVGLYLLYFYTDVVGISGSLAGVIYFIGMAWDAATDPFMGYMAERTRTKWGVYRPYLLFGNIPLALSFVLLFWVPPLEGSSLFFFLLFANILHRTCFTLVSVPFSSLTPRITSDSQERTNLTGFRMLGAQTGTNLMALLAFPIIFWVGGEDESMGFIVLASIAGITAILIHSITFITVKEPDNDQGIERVGGSLADAARAIGKNKPFWLVFSATLIVGITTIFFGNNLIYYTKYALDLHEHQGTILFTSGIVAFLSIPIWWIISNRLGKKITWLISSTITLSSLILFYFYDIKTLNELLFLVAFIGFGSGAGGILFWSMLPDTIEYAQKQFGYRADGMISSTASFFQKLAKTVGGAGVALVLGGAGYVANEQQSASALSAIHGILTLAPIPILVILILLTLFYRLDQETHGQIVKELSTNRSIND